MPVRCFLAFAAMLCASRLQADTREVVRITANGHETTYAQYLQGDKIRTENLEKNSPRPSVTVENPARRATYILDPSSRRYIEQPWYTDWIRPLTQWIARPTRVRESGKRVDIYYETIDTGERQQVFGRTARHLLLRERHVAEPGACERTREIDKDGWYLPWRESGKARLVFYLGFAGYRCQDIVIKHGNPRPPGFAIRETTDSITREVLEFSDDPLDESLFEVPSGFQKVDRLPGYQPASWYAQWQWEWTELERAIDSWFE